MHWQQWVTVTVFGLGFALNMATSFTRPEKAFAATIASTLMLMYQWVLWSGGWYQ